MARSRSALLGLRNGQKIGALRIRSYPEPGIRGTRAKPVGEGATSIVYLAEQSLYNSISVRRAVKFFVYRGDIAEWRGSEPISRSHFETEILNIAGFNHENVVRVIEAGLYKLRDGQTQVPFIVSEFIEGSTLKALIDSGGLLDCLAGQYDRVLDYIRQIFRGLSHLHARSFYHCDIAPKNIFLAGEPPNLRIVIGDLGIGYTKPAKNKERTAKHWVIGTYPYCPDPVREVWKQQLPSSKFFALQPAWDVYGAAKTALELTDALIPYAASQHWFSALRKKLMQACEAPGETSATRLVDEITWLQPETREVAHIAELTDSLPNRRVWPLPVSSVVTSDRVRRLANHGAVLRLKRVPQLLSSSLSFPGATHSRYEHSLGVYENMRQYLVALADDKTFLEFFSPELAETALVCALLSSVSHYPFSAAIKECRRLDDLQFPQHSVRSILDELFSWPYNTGRRRLLADQIREDFKRADPDTCMLLLSSPNGEALSPGQRIVRSLLNSSIGVRVVDYLRRDSLYTGISKSDPLDLAALLPYLTVDEDSLGIEAAGLSTVEQVVSLRYWMFNRVYWNRLSRSYLAMCSYMLMSLGALNDKFELGLRKIILRSNEREVLEYCRSSARNCGQLELEQLCNLLLQTRPATFWQLLEFNRSHDDVKSNEICEHFEGLSLSARLELQAKLNSYLQSHLKLGKGVIHLLLDMPLQPIHPKLGEDVYVQTYRNTKIPLVRYSGIVSGVKTDFRLQLQRMRIFVNPIHDKWAGDEKKTQLSAEVLKFLGEHL